MTPLRAQLESRLPRILDRVALAGSLLLAFAGLAAWTVGGGVWRLGPVAISLQRPLRSVGLAFALLLLRAAFRDRPGGRARASTLALLAALFGALALDSQARIVGDGQEYLAMAWNLGHGRPPALSAAELGEVEQVLALGQGELSAGREALWGSDERQDFHHFWLYSLVVAPLLAGVLAAGGMPLAAFTLANAALLLTAAAVVQSRLGPAAMVLLFGGPLLWWLDKPHPEAFLIALLASALTVATRRPGLALLLVGLAAAQNPVFCVVLGIASLWAFAGAGPRPAIPTLALAWGLALANPLYYLRHLGRAVPLRDTVLAHVPNWAELSAVVIDPNLGLLPAWPSLGLALALAAVCLFARGRGGERMPWRELAGLSVAVLALLVAFTQPGNLNHGGTRGMSRYALWLAPFVIPALACLRAACARGQLALAVLSGLSLVSAFQDYLPSRPERYFEPTPLARWLWTRHPRWDRPLPEVFAERAWGYPPLGSVPAGLPGCEMALVRGDGTTLGHWPLPCTPAEKPSWCRQAGALCYAKAAPGGYQFQLAPRQPTFHDVDRSRWYWSGAPAPGLIATIQRLPWRDLGIVAPGDEGVLLSGRGGCGRIQLRTAAGAYLAWFDGVRRDGAFVVPVVQAPSSAILLDPLTGEELSRMDLTPAAPASIGLPVRAPLLLVVRASR